MSVSLIIACLEVAVGAVVGFVGGVAFQKYGVSSNPSAEAQAVLQSSETDALQLSLRSDERREIPVQEETSTDGASEKPKAIRSQVSSLLPGGCRQLFRQRSRDHLRQEQIRKKRRFRSMCRMFFQKDYRRHRRELSRTVSVILRILVTERQTTIV